MHATLPEARATWEKGAKLLSFHVFPKLGMNLSILSRGGGRYDLIRYFPIGGMIATSVDCQAAPINEVWDRMAYLTGGQKQEDGIGISA